MKIRIVWIACLIFAGLGQAHAATYVIASFGAGAPRCQTADATALQLPLCDPGASFVVPSYQWGAAANSLGAVDLSDLTIQKFLDRSSPSLFMSMLKGSPIPLMRLTVYKDVGGPVPAVIYEIVMQKVFVTSLADSDSNGGGPPVQSVSFAPANFRVSVPLYDSTGNKVSTPTAIYNR